MEGHAGGAARRRALLANPVTAVLAGVMVLAWLPVLGREGSTSMAPGMLLIALSLPSLMLTTGLGHLVWADGLPGWYVVPSILAAQTLNVLWAGALFGAARRRMAGRERVARGARAGSGEAAQPQDGGGAGRRDDDREQRGPAERESSADQYPGGP
ncbi:hypothetical protein MTQ13_13645 [Streptomyces sp. XM4011]|uniref:hypothetical protein n=1 Tax=Streptomyces sp. XM4011 TaxID=2929780 RepID=UPI001FF71D51|nr:hypothetical protein [Streptomyces sp. XM4011]MCK1815312.1 hypothetical protein [Streptomyces sp. XM4011]